MTHGKQIFLTVNLIKIVTDIEGSIVLQLIGSTLYFTVFRYFILYLQQCHCINYFNNYCRGTVFIATGKAIFIHQCLC